MYHFSIETSSLSYAEALQAEFTSARIFTTLTDPEFETGWVLRANEPAPLSESMNACESAIGYVAGPGPIAVRFVRATT